MDFKNWNWQQDGWPNFSYNKKELDPLADEYTYTKKGNSAVITAPGEPREYEIRYILFQGRKLLGKATIQVVP